MAALQLSFSLRTSAHCKTVHLLGSWDNYNGQLPLSADKKTTGGFKGTFRFQPTTLQQGQRYWYYYIIDGYHVSHDPAQASTKEPTTGRMLNILDVPTVSSTGAKAKPARQSVEIPKGRPASKIISPKPQKPNQVFNIVNADYKQPTVDELAARFAKSSFEDSDDEYDSCPSMDGSVSSRSSSSLSSSSSSSNCSCERYGITRKGDRVKLDCGGSRCGFSDDSCSSESEDDVAYSPRSTRRHAVHIRR